MQGETNNAEVWFPIEKDKDGYPETRDWEGLWTRPTEQGYEILSVPFYLKSVSKGDIVEATQGKFLAFTEVLSRGAHNTYRLLVLKANASATTEIVAELRSKGLSVEVNETGILFAVDVPPSVPQQDIDVYLFAQKEAGRWSIQDGCVTNIKID